MPQVGKYEVYTDGSYIKGKVTYGFVILRDGEAQHEGAGIVPPSFAQSRQVGGEIMAVLEALKWFEANGVDGAAVHYDFENLALWVRGVYKTNTDISRALVDAVRRSPVKLTWTKVKAHTGVHWNERVDQLAKGAAMGSAPVVDTSDKEAPASKAAPSPSGDPLVNELERIVEPLQAAAASMGVDTRFVGILNNMFLRLEILSGEKRVATFDLYNTQKKRLNPIITPLGPLQAQNMAVLWDDFKRKWRG